MAGGGGPFWVPACTVASGGFAGRPSGQVDGMGTYREGSPPLCPSGRLHARSSRWLTQGRFTILIRRDFPESVEESRLFVLLYASVPAGAAESLLWGGPSAHLFCAGSGCDPASPD